MPIGDNTALQITAFILFSVLCAYAGGRVHQWYKHSMDRDRSFREGYSHGYHALFSIAARNGRLATDQPDPGDPERTDLP